MDELAELKRDNANLRQQLKVALDTVDLYEKEDIDKYGYYTLKAYVKQQIDVLKEFKLKEEIAKNPKDDKLYDRVKAVGEGIKSMISDLRSLRAELKLTKQDDLENEDIPFVETFAQTRK